MLETKEILIVDKAKSAAIRSVLTHNKKTYISFVTN